MTARWGVLLAAMTVALSMAGCADNAAQSGPQTTTIEVSYDDALNQRNITRAVTLNVGDTLQVSLASNPSTGFGWAPDMQITNAAVMAQAGHEVLGPVAGRVGSAGREVWALQAIGPGTTTVSTTYGRPWPGGEKDALTFTAEVTVD